MPIPAKDRLGELAVEFGLVSREHIEHCLEYQRALRQRGDPEDKSIGDILVEKGLLKPGEVDQLLGDQRRLRHREPPPEKEPSEPPARVEDLRDVAEREATAERPGRPLRLVLLHPAVVASVVGLAVVGAAVALLWPAPAPKRALAAYLESCREGSRQPDPQLAIGDLGLTVRRVRVEQLLEPVRHDYARELGSLDVSQDQENWPDLLAQAPMPNAKRRVFRLIAPAIPEALVPEKIDSLVVTVQPIRCSGVLRLKSNKLFAEGTFDFLVVRVEAPRWTSQWLVAACDRVK